MPVSWKMAWRETRAHWPRFVCFALSVAVGVSAIVAVDQVSDNVARAIHRDAKALLGGDIALTVSHALGPSVRQVLESLKDRHIVVSHVRELVGMAARGASRTDAAYADGTPQLVEVKAVPLTYPLYGHLGIRPAQPLAEALARQSECPMSPCYGALVEESLLFRFQRTIGDVVNLGQAHLKITGVLVNEPDRVATAFRLGPRVIISQQALTATGLVQKGSRIRERYLLKVPPTISLNDLVQELRGRLATVGARITTYHDAQPRIRRFLDQLATYLRLIGLTALFVGGIGIALTIQGHLAKKTMNVAVLKTLGADSRTICQIYGLQSAFIAMLGSAVGIGLGAGMHAGMSWFVEEMLSLPISRTMSLAPIAKGMSVGLVTSLAFTLWPLLTIRHIPPALVFRRSIEAPSISNPHPKPDSLWKSMMSIVGDRPRVLTGLAGGACLVGLTVWQAGSWSFAGFFIAVMSGAVCLFSLLALGVITILKRFPTPHHVLLKHAVQNISRPGSHTLGMLVAIGISVMLITCLVFTKQALMHALVQRIPAQAPSFFFIDIQPDQRAAFEQVLRREAETQDYRITPVVRSRVVAINGMPIDPEAYRGTRDGWYFTREYVLTALEHLPEDNVLVRGTWWDKKTRTGLASSDSRASASVWVSVEEDAAKHLHLDVGDTLTLSIQGLTLTATVASLRKVDWSSFSMNFFMILSPGSLEHVPFTYIASAYVDREREDTLQRALVSILPNITAIKVGDVLDLVIALIRRVAWAAEGLALFSLLNGALVVAAALSSTWHRRIFESAMLKVLGATRGMILRIFAVEFLILGTIAGFVGVGMALGLSWGITRFFLAIPWVFDPATAGLAFMLTAVSACILGFLGTSRLSAFPPLRVLRQE